MSEPTLAQLDQRAQFTIGSDHMYAKNRKLAPNGKRKLSTAQMTEIQYLRGDGVNPRDIAIEFGVTAGHIRQFTPLDRP